MDSATSSRARSRRDRQHLANRLDAVLGPLIVDESDHVFDRRSAPPGQNKTTLCAGSRSLGELAVFPLQRLHPFAQLARNARAPGVVDLGFLGPLVQRLRRVPTFDEIDSITAQRDTCWCSLSNTMRTAHWGTSGEYLFVVLLMGLHPTHELEPPADPTRSMSRINRDGCGPGSARRCCRARLRSRCG